MQAAGLNTPNGTASLFLFLTIPSSLCARITSVKLTGMRGQADIYLLLLLDLNNEFKNSIAKTKKNSSSQKENRAIIIEKHTTAASRKKAVKNDLIAPKRKPIYQNMPYLKEAVNG